MSTSYQTKTFSDGDYEYTAYYTSSWTPTYTLSVRVLNTGKTAYGDIPQTVTFEEAEWTVTSLSHLITGVGCFSSCIRLQSPPAIPPTVFNMINAFRFCRSMFYFPTIPSGVDSMTGCFAYCFSAVIQNGSLVIPQGVVDLTECFRGCKTMSGHVYVLSEDSNINFTDTFTDTECPIVLHTYSKMTPFLSFKNLEIPTGAILIFGETRTLTNAELEEYGISQGYRLDFIMDCKRTGSIHNFWGAINNANVVNIFDSNDNPIGIDDFSYTLPDVFDGYMIITYSGAEYHSGYNISFGIEPFGRSTKVGNTPYNDISVPSKAEKIRFQREGDTYPLSVFTKANNIVLNSSAFFSNYYTGLSKPYYTNVGEAFGYLICKIYGLEWGKSFTATYTTPDGKEIKKSLSFRSIDLGDTRSMKIQHPDSNNNMVISHYATDSSNCGGAGVAYKNSDGYFVAGLNYNGSLLAPKGCELVLAWDNLEDLIEKLYNKLGYEPC